MQEEYEKSLKESIKHLQIADHMAYVTYPLVNDKRLLLKIFEEVYKSIMNSIDSMVFIEYPMKSINEVNEVFIQRFLKEFGKNYGLISERISKIFEIVEMNKRHRQSAMEFVRKDKIVIMSDSLKILTLNINKVKEYLLLAKELIIGINEKIREKTKYNGFSK